jgi:hypothetical protein
VQLLLAEFAFSFFRQTVSKDPDAGAMFSLGNLDTALLPTLSGSPAPAAGSAEVGFFDEDDLRCCSNMSVATTDAHTAPAFASRSRMAEPGQSRIFFFKVVKASLAHERFCKPPHSDLQDPVTSCMAIARHPLIFASNAERVAFLALESFQQQRDQSMELLSPTLFRSLGIQTLTPTLRRWQVSAQLWYTLAPPAPWVPTHGHSARGHGLG